MLNFIFCDYIIEVVHSLVNFICSIQRLCSSVLEFSKHAQGRSQLSEEM